MRPKSDRRLLAERLRREEGLSYNEIAARTAISKSTLSNWLRDVPLSPEHEQRLQERLRMNRGAFAARALPINHERYTAKRLVAFQGGSDVVAQLPDEVAIHELAFAMLYLGEGAKKGNRVEVASTSPDILKYVWWVLDEIYGVGIERITCRLHLISLAESLDIELRSWWSIRLGMPLTRFQKTCYDKRPRDVSLTEDYHGVCILRCLDTYLQQRILGLAHSYLESATSMWVQKSSLAIKKLAS